MCDCATRVATQLASLQTDMTWLKEDNRRRLNSLEDKDREIQEQMTAAIKEQTAVNSVIHGRISRVKYLTLGALGIGATVGAGVDWLKEFVTKLGN